jgi:integrase
VGHIQKKSRTSSRTGKVVVSWQARYTGPDGKERAKRFGRRVDAENWIAINEADLLRGAWIDPQLGRISLEEYAHNWLQNRTDLRSTTRAKYQGLLERHVLQQLGCRALNGISPDQVRTWYGDLYRRHPTTAAGAYRLLATIYNTAVEDDLVSRTPCRVKGGSQEKSEERPIARSVVELDTALEACAERYRLAILLAAYCQLRRGEVLGLQRRDLSDYLTTLKIVRTWVQLSDGPAVQGPPKSKAGQRLVNIPPHMRSILADHLNEFAAPGKDGWLFPGKGDKPISPRTLDRAWDVARRAVGRPELHLHDLRHTGLTWSAMLGATTAELKHRAGHDSAVAALRYQHATQDRDRAIADALGELATGDIVQLRRTRDGQSFGDGSAKTTSGQEQPQRDSNPCRHLERVVS